jgi:hypothetical protein
MNALRTSLFILALASACQAAEPKAPAAKTSATPPAPKQAPRIPNLEFIDTSFENASPLWYEQGPDNSILVHLLYDHERNSSNRAAGHLHFRLVAKPAPS